MGEPHLYLPAADGTKLSDTSAIKSIMPNTTTKALYVSATQLITLSNSSAGVLSDSSRELMASRLVDPGNKNKGDSTVKISKFHDIADVKSGSAVFIFKLKKDTSINITGSGGKIILVDGSPNEGTSFTADKDTEVAVMIPPTGHSITAVKDNSQKPKLRSDLQGLRDSLDAYKLPVPDKNAPSKLSMNARNYNDWKSMQPKYEDIKKTVAELKAIEEADKPIENKSFNPADLKALHGMIGEFNAKKNPYLEMIDFGSKYYNEKNLGADVKAEIKTTVGYSIRVIEGEIAAQEADAKKRKEDKKPAETNPRYSQGFIDSFKAKAKALKKTMDLSLNSEFDKKPNDTKMASANIPAGMENVDLTGIADWVEPNPSAETRMASMAQNITLAPDGGAALSDEVKKVPAPGVQK